MIEEALADTRVVLVNGARQCGKTTLVAHLARKHRAEWRSLDNSATRRAAISDPTGFVAETEPLMIIDEIQRAPELLLSIKESVDFIDSRPGRFLLTGSARILFLRSVPDVLPGRMETIPLWPLSQGEIDGQPDGFVDAVFSLGPKLRHESAENRAGYRERVARGGFPEAVARDGRRRQRFLTSYVWDLINRDVIQISEITRGPDMYTLCQLVAARSGQLLVPLALSRKLELSHQTVQRYLRLLEETFLIQRIPAWSRNLSSRATGTAKVAMVDSGIATRLVSHDSTTLGRHDSPYGALLEGFVAMEIARQLTWADQEVDLFHYRTKDGVEVDLVLENRRRQVVGIEVKASSTVGGEDFRGLRHIADRVGDDFLVGIVFYTGNLTLPFGPRMRAVPIAALWEMSAP